MLLVVYLVVIAAGFFLLVVRPQRRQMAARRALVASVDVGDEVVTTGGIYGTIRSAGDETLELEIAPAVVITVARGAVAGVVTRPAAGGLGLDQLRSAAPDDDEPHHELPEDEPGDGRPDAAGGAG